MAQKLKIKSDRGFEIHFNGVFDDHTLCGLSTSQDSLLAIGESETTDKKVTCSDCIKIVTLCKTIELKEYKKPKI